MPLLPLLEKKPEMYLVKIIVVGGKAPIYPIGESNTRTIENWREIYEGKKNEIILTKKSGNHSLDEPFR